MQRLGPVILVSSIAPAGALAFPPAAGKILVMPQGVADVPELDLELGADATSAVTAAALYGAVAQPVVIADQVTTFSAATDLATHAAHGLKLGDGPLNFTSTLTLPPELTPAAGAGPVLVYAVPVDANTYKLATSRENALAGTTIDLTGAGTGVITAHDDATTTRLVWQQFSQLGLANDGAVSLDVQLGYRKTFPHRSRVVAYAVAATISAGNVSASLYAVADK